MAPARCGPAADVSQRWGSRPSTVLSCGAAPHPPAASQLTRAGIRRSKGGFGSRRIPGAGTPFGRAFKGLAQTGVSWIFDLRRFAGPTGNRIGPGRLVLVVGPSGAGKDTLIDGARLSCAGDPTVVFPQRAITRPASLNENNMTTSEQDFKQSVVNGTFALWWDAHGLRYGLSVSIDDDIRSGRTVVCNASRTIVGEARRRYAFVTVARVTALRHILESRLASRARASDGDIPARMARSLMIEMSTDADVVIHNSGSAKVGIRRLVNVIRDAQFFVLY